MKKSGLPKSRTPSELIDARIRELGDWRGTLLRRLRRLVKEADPDVVEEWKWRGVPVWSHDGMICTGETYKNVVKMTFAKGAALKDPSRLFNSSLDGNTRRAIDLREGERLDEEALKRLVSAAVTLNTSKAGRRSSGPKPAVARSGARGETARAGAMTYGSHEDYFASVPADVRARLAAIQARVELLVPGVERCIGYRMPAYRGRRIFFYFAAFKKHIGIYPPVSRDRTLIAELARYRNEKGNLSFPLNEPLPIELIGRVAVALHREHESG